MKTHYTNDAKPTAQSIPVCQGNPKPRWQLTNDRAKVTCEKCTAIAGQQAPTTGPQPTTGPELAAAYQKAMDALTALRLAADDHPDAGFARAMRRAVIAAKANISGQRTNQMTQPDLTKVATQVLTEIEPWLNQR